MRPFFLHGFLRGFLWLFLLTSFTEKRTACALPLFLCPECKAGSHKIHQIRDFKNSSNTEGNKKHLSDDGIIISIPPKTSIFQIVFLLEQQKIITNKWSFLFRAFLSGCAKKIKAGQYSFKKNSAANDILHHLTQGSCCIHYVCLPEGYTVHQMLLILQENPCLEGTITVMPQEGTLLPGTYYFTKGEKRDAMVKRLQKAQQSWLDTLEPFPCGLSREDLVTLSSIVEKETSIYHEKGEIAGVFLRRLKENRRLQADPTIIYGMTLGKKKMDRPLVRKDWQFASPYNTYRNAGLPPTPICCPGKETLKAVAGSSSSSYLYFVAIGNGRHAFSASLEQHNKVIAEKRKRKNLQTIPRH